MPTPKSDHFDGRRFVNPTGSAGQPFSKVPRMLLERRIYCLTAMGTSMQLVWNNLPALLAWGAIVLILFLLSLATSLLGLIVVFPLLGHGTWHVYRALHPA